MLGRRSGQQKKHAQGVSLAVIRSISASFFRLRAQVAIEKSVALTRSNERILARFFMLVQVVCAIYFAAFLHSVVTMSIARKTVIVDVLTGQSYYEDKLRFEVRCSEQKLGSIVECCCSVEALYTTVELLFTSFVYKNTSVDVFIATSDATVASMVVNFSQQISF